MPPPSPPACPRCAAMRARWQPSASPERRERRRAQRLISANLAQSRRIARLQRMGPLALAAGTLVLVAAGAWWASPVRPRPPQVVATAESHEEAPTQLAEAAADAGPVAVASMRPEWAGVGLDLPTKPWPGQRLAPCKGVEKEIRLKDGSRACWFEVKAAEDKCKDSAYEYDGGCYLPSYPPPKTPPSSKTGGQ